MYLAVDEGFFGHWKTQCLARLLKDARAPYHLLLLWNWTCRYAKSGDLSRFTAEQIEAAAAWDGEPGAFFAAAITAGFIDHVAEPPVTVKLHDWEDWSGRWIAKWAALAERNHARRLSKASTARTRPVHGPRKARTRPVHIEMRCIEGEGDEREGEVEGDGGGDAEDHGDAPGWYPGDTGEGGTR